MITWLCGKNTFIPLILAEIDIMAANIASCESTWLHKLLIGLFDLELDSTMMYYDIEVVSNSLRIQYSMASPSLLRSCITSSET